MVARWHPFGAALSISGVLLLSLLFAPTQSSTPQLSPSFLCDGRNSAYCTHGEGSRRERCSLHLTHHWTAKTESSVYASLLAVPLFPEHGGHGPQIVAATLSGYVELIDGDGSRPQGWPVSFQEHNFHSAPLLYDIDADNRVDVLVGDRDGKVELRPGP